MTLAALLLLADLEIASVTPAKPALTTDETFTFAVKVHNRGPEEAKGVRVTVGTNALTLMKSIAAPSGWTCEQGPVFAYKLTCTASTLAPEAAADFTATLTSPQHAATTFRISALVQSVSEDESDANDRREKAMAIEATEANAELSLTAAIEANQVNVEVKNAGPRDARDVMVVLSEAKQLAFKASGRGWKCNGAICTRPLMKAGTSASLKAAAAPGATISARVRAEKNRESAQDNAAKITLP